MVMRCDSQISERVSALVEHLPVRKLHAVLSSDLPNDGHLAAIDAPIGSQDIVGNFPRRSAGEGHQP
jgi:hypothetical protein